MKLPLKQHEIERMAREAEKVYGITTALDMSLLESRGIDPQEVCGAFTAVQDIAKKLREDLEKLVEGETV